MKKILFISVLMTLLTAFNLMAQTNPVPYSKNVGTTNDTVTFGLSGAKILTVENFGTADTDTIYVYTQTVAGGYNSAPFVIPRNQKSRFEYTGNKAIFKSTRNYVFARYYTGDYWYNYSGYVFNLQLADTADFKPDIRALEDTAAVHNELLQSHVDSIAAHNTLLQSHVDSLAAHNTLLQAHNDSIAALRDYMPDTTRLAYLDKSMNTLQLSSTPVEISDTTLSCTLGNNFYKSLTADVEFVIDGIADGQVINVAVINDSIWTVSWSLSTGTLKWVAGTPPTQTTGTFEAEHIDVYTFVKMGSSVYGTVIQNY